MGTFYSSKTPRIFLISLFDHPVISLICTGLGTNFKSRCTRSLAGSTKSTSNVQTIQQRPATANSRNTRHTTLVDTLLVFTIQNTSSIGTTEISTEPYTSNQFDCIRFLKYLLERLYSVTTMSRTSSRIKEMEVGRRTGLILPPTSAFIADEGLESPGQLFDAAAIVEESPNASVDGSVGKGHDASTALADFAATESKKPKVKVRFSLGDEVAETFDSRDVNTLKAQHPVRKLITGKNRDSIDTMDLSSVSTAPSVASLKKDVDEGDVEASRQNSEEAEIASIVAVAHKHAKPQNPAVLTDSPIISHAPDIGYDDDDDDLIPPPPPDSPQHDDVEEELHTQPGDENEVDFPNTVDEDDAGDDNDGAGFEMNEDDHDKDDEQEYKDAINELRRRKEERIEKLAEKKRSKSSKNDKKKTIQTDQDESDGEDVVKPKSKLKKKVNPYSTHFSPKGVPGPRTYTQIPLSDLKADTPEDTQVRRSKRVRVAPLEYWRGEKPIFGGNDFGDEFDGVKNMPVVIGISKPDPTPYKKRKVVPAVSNPKKKSGDQRRGYNDDGPAMIAADEPFDSTTLRQKLPVNDGKVAHLWDERFQEARGISTFYIPFLV
jgi:hypothetical protein